MLDLPIEDLLQFVTGLVFLVPGALIIYVRSRFLTGRRRSHAEEALSYVIITLLYFAITLPGFVWFANRPPSNIPSWLGWIALVLAGPVFVGIVSGLAHQNEWTKIAARAVGLKLVHPVPTAWDWKFGHQAEQWLIIKLKDGTTYYGYFGQQSFASSDEERDIYVEQIFDFEGESNWQPLPQGLWLQVSEVSTIEFLPVERGSKP